MAQEHRRYRVTIDEAGRLDLPEAARAALNVKSGEELLIVQEGDSFQLLKADHFIRKAQAFFRGLAPENVSFVDELIREHREEALRETPAKTRPLSEVVNDAQTLFMNAASPDRVLSEELMQERREEVAREEKESEAWRQSFKDKN